VLFEAMLSDPARAFLAHRTDTEIASIWRCIGILEANPHLDEEHITTLFLPPGLRYSPAFACDGWAIAFRIIDNHFVYIRAIGPADRY
jgi:hypothetical protein